MTENIGPSDNLHLFDDIVRNVPFGLCIWHLENADDPRSLRLRAANPAASRMTGVGLENCVGKLIHGVFPAVSHALLETFAQVVRSQQPADLGDFRYGDERVAERFWAVKAFPLPDRCVGVAFEDASARKEAEALISQLNEELEQRVIERTAALAESQARLAAIIDSAKDAIIITEADQRITLFNAAAEAMFRCRAEHAVGQPLSRFIPKEFRAAVHANGAEASESLSCLVRSGKRGVRADGEEFQLEASVARGEVGGQKFYTVIIRDVTQRERAEEARRKSEALFRLIWENAADGMRMTDARGTVVLVNDAFCSCVGKTRAELEGQPLSVTHQADRREHVLRAYQEQFARRAFPEYLEKRVELWDGRTVWFALANFFLELPEQPPLLVTRFRDVSERKHTDEAVRESQARKAAIFESVLDALITMNHEGKIVEFNAAAERIFGYTHAQALHHDLAELIIPPRLRDAHRQGLARFLATGDGPVFGKRLEMPALRSDGTEFPAELTVTRIAGVDPPLFTGYLRDITERKRAEAEIREKAALLDQAHDAILVCDLEDRIKFWNQGAERLYGWTVGETVGRVAADLLYKERSAELVAAQRAELEKGEWTGELVQITKEGKPITVESRRTLLHDDQGRPKSKLVINTDVTEKRKLQTQYLRAQRMESLGTLAGGIAHDLNNVLTPIVMAVDLLKMAMPEPQRLTMISTLQVSADRGTDMVRQILSFARGVEGQHVPLDMRPVIKEIDKMLRHTLPKSLEINSKLAADLWLVSGDATQLTQVLMNLCVNARDAMPKGGRLLITAENAVLDEHYARMHLEARPGRYVVIHVSDTGTGIPPDLLDKIFDPFFTTKEVGKGTGLGLSTVLGIVKSHSGFVSVYSEVGKGTHFTVYLPAADVGEDAAPEKPQTLPTGQGELILVVDDEATIREITKATLEAHGYQTLTAADGAEGLALYAQHREQVRLVLTDMMMPVMDGPAAIRALRKLDPHLPIIAASGLAAAKKPPDLAELGAQAFLTKPYTAAKLLTTLREVLRR